MSQFRKLQHISRVQPGLELVIYGRGRHRTLAAYWVGRRLAKVHYSEATKDAAADALARQLTLDGELPKAMEPLT